MHINSDVRTIIFTGKFKRWTSTRLLGFVLAMVFLSSSNPAAAQVLVFDRGLPTANLNSAAGPSRSNVQWADVETLPETPWLPGDDFTLPGSDPYVITRIRVWSTNNTGLSLWGGAAGGTIAFVSNTYTADAVTYANGDGYETAAGGFLPLYQIDFSVNIPLNGGVTYQFFLDGPAVPVGTPPGDNSGALLHASNAPLSGSTQQGADDTFLFLGNDGTVYTWNSVDGGGTYCPGCVGWDKNSDGNVQVFVAPAQPWVLIPVPAASAPVLAGLALLLAGAGLLFFARGRRRA